MDNPNRDQNAAGGQQQQNPQQQQQNPQQGGGQSSNPGGNQSQERSREQMPGQDKHAEPEPARRITGQQNPNTERGNQQGGNR